MIIIPFFIDSHFHISSSGTCFVQSTTDYNASELIIVINPSCAFVCECFKTILDLISNLRRVLNVVCFFWAISWRLNFICQRFETLCLSHLHRRVGVKNSLYLPAYEDGTECFETLAYKIQMAANYPEESTKNFKFIFIKTLG